MTRPMKFKGRGYYEHVHATLEQRLGVPFDETESRRVADKIIDEIVTEQIYADTNVVMVALKQSVGVGLGVGAYSSLASYFEDVQFLVGRGADGALEYDLNALVLSTAKLPVSIALTAFFIATLLYVPFYVIKKMLNKSTENSARDMNIKVAAANRPSLFLVEKENDKMIPMPIHVYTYEQLQKRDYTEDFKRIVLDDLPINEHRHARAKIKKRARLGVTGVLAIAAGYLAVTTEHYLLAAAFGTAVTSHEFLEESRYYRRQIAKRLDHAVRFYTWE